MVLRPMIMTMSYQTHENMVRFGHYWGRGGGYQSLSSKKYIQPEFCEFYCDDDGLGSVEK